MSFTTVDPLRSYRQNWPRKRVDDGELGWLIGTETSEDGTPTQTFVRIHGTAYRKALDSGPVELAADHRFNSADYSAGAHAWRREAPAGEDD